MLNRRQALGFAGALVLAAFPLGVANALGTKLVVTVVNKQGKPAAGARVTVYMGKGGEGDPIKLVGEGKTDKDGKLTIIVLDDVEGQKFLGSANDGESKGTRKVKAKTGKTKMRIKLAWPVV